MVPEGIEQHQRQGGFLHLRTTLLSWAQLALMNRQCHAKVLILPLTLRKLRALELEILPNRQICIAGQKMRDICMPNNPVHIQLKNKWSMFVSETTLFENDNVEDYMMMYPNHQHDITSPMRLSRMYHRMTPYNFFGRK